MKTGRWTALLAVAASAAMVACGGGGGGVGSGSTQAPAAPTGTLRVGLTDAPACGFREVNVTVERVRSHMSSTASDNDGAWTDIVVSPGPRTINLLDLMNGVVADLGQVTLPAGRYTQVRLVLSSNNTVLPEGGSIKSLDTPSATQSGLKLTPGFTVEPDKLTDLVIDFDACRSIVQRGNGTYGLKPVLSVIPATGAVIQGYVQPGVAGVTVSAQKDGVVLRATQPNAEGLFVLAPVDPTKTPYDIVFSAADRKTSVVTNVPAAANTTTNVGTSAAAILMATSASGSASGTVTLSGPAATTPSVRALQQVTPAIAVEVAHVNANVAGEYSLSLPVEAPLLAPYASPLPLGSFTSQVGAAAKYRLEASATGYAPKLGDEITVVSGTPKTAQDFTLVLAP